MKQILDAVDANQQQSWAAWYRLARWTNRPAAALALLGLAGIVADVDWLAVAPWSATIVLHAVSWYATQQMRLHTAGQQRMSQALRRESERMLRDG